MAAGRKRNKAKRESDLLTIADMYRKGTPQVQIARVLEVSPATISLDIKELHRRWLEHSMVDFNDARAKELAKIDLLEREAWEAFQRSVGTKTKETAERKTGDMNIETAKRVQHQDAGDPRFLERVGWCIEKRCRLLGLEKISVDLGDLPVVFQIAVGDRNMERDLPQRMTEAEVIDVAGIDPKMLSGPNGNGHNGHNGASGNGNGHASGNHNGHE